MAKFKSDKYPALVVVVPGGRVRFVGGEAEATGEAAGVVRSLGDEYGVEQVEADVPKRTVARKIEK